MSLPYWTQAQLCSLLWQMECEQKWRVSLPSRNVKNISVMLFKRTLPLSTVEACIEMELMPAWILSDYDEQTILVNFSWARSKLWQAMVNSRHTALLTLCEIMGCKVTECTQFYKACQSNVAFKLRYLNGPLCSDCLWIKCGITATLVFGSLWEGLY